MSLIVCSPVAGTVVTLDEVPDVVFAGRLLGAGLAVEPDPDDEQTMVSPVAGVLSSLYPHAAAIESPAWSGSERVLLVHLGIDTVELRGDGFLTHLDVGAAVRCGTRIITWSPREVTLGGRSAMCPIVAMGSRESDLEQRLEPGERVLAGEPLFIWL